MKASYGKLYVIDTVNGAKAHDFLMSLTPLHLFEFFGFWEQDKTDPNDGGSYIGAVRPLGSNAIELIEKQGLTILTPLGQGNHNTSEIALLQEHAKRAKMSPTNTPKQGDAMHDVAAKLKAHYGEPRFSPRLY